MRFLARMVCESEDGWGLEPPHPKTTTAECNHCAGEVYLQVDARSVDFLTFCVDRLVHVYGESPNTDYILHAREALGSIDAGDLLESNP